MVSKLDVFSQVNLIENGDFEDLRMIKSIKLSSGNESGAFAINDTAIGWIQAKRELVPVVSKFWNEEDTVFNIWPNAYYSDSNQAFSGHVYAYCYLKAMQSKTTGHCTSICGSLKTPLTKGQPYRISFKLKYLSGNILVGEIGAKLSVTRVPGYHEFISKDANSQGHWNSQKLAIKTNINGYQFICFDYVAEGGEVFLTLGGISNAKFKSARTFGIFHNGSWPLCMVAIDDVEVVQLNDSDYQHTYK